MELGVDRVRADLARVELAPDGAEADVVLAPAERARPMAGCERRRLVEEEQLGELARLEERASMPTAEREPARDPALSVVPPSDAAMLVVEAAAVAVHQAAARIRDQLAERRDPILQRHSGVNLAAEDAGHSSFDGLGGRFEQVDVRALDGGLRIEAERGREPIVLEPVRGSGRSGS